VLEKLAGFAKDGFVCRSLKQVCPCSENLYGIEFFLHRHAFFSAQVNAEIARTRLRDEIKELFTQHAI